MITINTQGMNDAFSYAAEHAGRFTSSAAETASSGASYCSEQAGIFARHAASAAGSGARAAADSITAENIFKAANFAYKASYAYGVGKTALEPFSRDFEYVKGAYDEEDLFERVVKMVVKDPVKYTHLAACVISSAIFFTGASVPVGDRFGLRVLNSIFSMFRLFMVHKGNPGLCFYNAGERIGFATRDSFVAAGLYFVHLTGKDGYSGSLKGKAAFRWEQAKTEFSNEWNHGESILRPTVCIAAMAVLTGSMLA